MPGVKLTDINHAATLLKQIVKKADLNKDGAIRSGDTDKIRQAAGLMPSTSAAWMDGSDTAHVLGGIGAAVGRAKSRGGPQIAKINDAIDDFKKLTRAGDTDRNGTLGEAEQKRLGTAGEKNFIQFVVWARKKDISDVVLPKAQAPGKPAFRWSGTTAQVADSLLAAHSERGNDNFWPSWGGGKTSARYVINASEAREMIDALKPLYAGRRRAVLTELANRSKTSSYGCVSPNAAARKLLEDYGATLGLTVHFGQPSAPKMPSP